MKTDKLLHFIISLILTVAGIYILHDFLLVVVIVFGLGLAKELYDRYIRKTYFSIGDLWFDFLGIIAGMFLFLLLVGFGLK